MRILIIHCAYNHKGGEDTVVNEEAKMLAANGHTVDQLFFNNNGHTLLKLLMLPFNISSYFIAKRRIRQFRPTVVHIHNLHFAASASVIYATKWAKVPIVATIHNFRLLCPSASLFYDGKIFTNSLNQRFPWKAIQNKVYRNSAVITFWLSICTKLHQLLRTWEKCNRLIVLNENTRQLFLHSAYRFRQGQIVVKPNFCAEPMVKNSERRDYFLYVGRLTVEKGIDVLLEAFVKTRLPLKIVGDGPLKEKIIKYATMYPEISYVGVVPKEKIFELMEGCTALVFPSIWYEGMPLTIIEAFSCGTPVIASRLGAMENMIEDKINGLHFEPGSEPDLIAKLKHWHLLPKNQQKKYSEGGHFIYRQYYTLGKNYKQLVSIYNGVLRKNKHDAKENYTISY